MKHGLSMQSLEEAEKELNRLKLDAVIAESNGLVNDAKEIGNIEFAVEAVNRLKESGRKIVQKAVNSLERAILIEKYGKKLIDDGVFKSLNRA